MNDDKLVDSIIEETKKELEAQNTVEENAVDDIAEDSAIEETVDEATKEIKTEDIDDDPTKQIPLTREERAKKVKEDKKKEKYARKIREKSRNKAIKEEGRPKKTPTKKKITPRGVIAIIILLAIAFGIFMLITNRDLVSCESFGNLVQYGILNKDKEQTFPISINGSISKGNFSRLGNYLCYTSDTTFSVVNNYGRSPFSDQISYVSPILETSNYYGLVYNLGDKGFEINSKSEQVYQGEMENNILVATINDDGMYALVTEYDGYLSKLFVYNNSNELMYTYAFADYYVTSVSLNSNGRRILLSGVSALDGNEISAIYVLDITKESPVVFKEYEDNIIYKVSYLGDNYGCAIGNNACYGFKTNADEFIETKYDGKNMTSFAISREAKKFFVSLSRSGDNRNCSILTFKCNGELKNINDTNLTITNLSSYKSRVGALADSKIYLFNDNAKDGIQVSKKDVSLDVKAIVLYSSKDAYVLGVSEITRIDL